MADGGQRLLDVIDDPNALESFLGGLTADTELLPSAETVDNVVASLARSLDDNEYEVDSPNETLFDTLDSSSNHLTDISRSYVPSDYDHGSVHTDGFGNSLEGYSNGNNVIRGGLGQHEQQTHVQTPGCEQFIGSSSNNNNSTIINSVISASSVNTTNNTTVTGSTLKQIIASSVPNCDPSKSTPNYVHTGQLQLNQNSASNNLSFAFSSQDLQKHNIEVSHNQLNQVTSLSSVSLEGQLQQNAPSNSTNNLISVVGAGHENGSGSTLTNSNSTGFRVVATQQSGQKIVAVSNVSQSISAAGSVQVTSGAASGVSNAVISSGASTIASSNVTLSTTTNVVGSNLASIQHQQQYIANTSTHQLMSGQTVSIPSMTVSAPQLIANSQGGLVASAGQNILQQIQSAGGGQSYIAMEQPTALIATGPSTFGTNVALLATGGTPTYAVLPTTQQFLTNAIIPQPTIQTLTKAANGAYFQTTGTPQIVATSTVNALQNVGTAVTTSNTTTPPVTSVSSSTEANNGGTGLTSQQTLPTSSASTVTDGVMTQLIQQSQQQITNVSGNTGTVSLTPQQSFAIGNAAGIGQVVVSQVGSLSTMTTPQQTQLSGTIVLNQYGQPMLLPSASTAQAGLQLILRQQPTQPQVLTIQTPTGTAALNAQATAQAATASGKPIVRYVSQMQQLAQTSGYGIQQIQTANGPTWVAVRYPQVSQASQFSQIQTDSIINASAALQNQISNNAQSQLQLQSQQSQQVQIHLQQQQQQAQQLIQQTQQQQQIQLQGGLAQASLSVQQQVQNTNQQLQMQAQQQLSMQSQVQLQNHQGQISNLQHQVQSQQTHNVQQTMSQSPMPMETQNMSTPTQPNQFINRPNKTLMHHSMNNSPQTQPSRDVEQQQISVPDSSSEPPPPKKAKTKSKSSKKKVTLDLEQLLKQSGIMDEDLQDDMSFDFGFGSMMDMQPNGLPMSPQVPPPAQIPVINTTEPPKKASKKKSNSKKSQAQPPPPPPVVLPPPPVTTPSPSAKTSKKKSPPKKKNAPPPPSTPPPPLPPPPPIVTPTKSKSSKKKSSNSSGNVNENQKSEPKTASSKKTVPPKKVSSLDTLLATIDAVAAAGASYSQSPQSSPSSLPPPPSQPATPSRKPTPSPKSKSKSKSKAAKNSAPTTPSPKMDNFLPSVPTSTTMTFPVPSSTPSHSMMPTSSLPSPQTQSSLPTAVVAPTINTSTAPPPSISPAIPTSRVTGPNLTNGSTSVTTSQTGLTRVVQTIQLTPQNQQLLRNIQGEIQRLCNIPQRNESEQAALQKLVVLQQQVIATGTPVPNPTHLNNLAQIVNVESISLATPTSATVPSSDTASASSCSTNVPLVSPCESDLTPSPVSSTVVATTTMSVLANANLINSSSKLISSKLSGNSGSSPVLATTTAGGGGSSSSNGACIIVGSPSVSSTSSPDSTSNLASNLNIEQCSVLPSSITTTATNNPTPNVNSGGLGSIVVSNVKADLGQLVASLSVPPSEDKNKDNTQMKAFQGVTTSTSTSVPVPTQSSVSFSQHLQHVPPPTNSYAPPTFSTRSVLDEKKAEEQRLSNLKAEEEKRARWKKEEFEMLLQRDQQYVVKPDYEIPFNSKKDAVERLMKYHIYRDRNDMNFEEFDAEFGNNAGILLEKFSVMMSKYRNLLLKESTKEVGCAERVMLERMFVSEEKVRLDQDRMLVAQGDVLELPLPPDSWVPKIKEMVDKEMMEFEPQDPVVSQQVQSAVDSIIGCGSADTNNYLLEEGDKIEYDAFGVPINSSGYAGVAASSADIDEAVRSILT